MVGSSRVQKVDTRIISATNTDLSHLIKKGLFREDLYFRLNIVEISLPPTSQAGIVKRDLVPFVPETVSEKNGCFKEYIGLCKTCKKLPTCTLQNLGEGLGNASIMKRERYTNNFSREN